MKMKNLAITVLASLSVLFYSCSEDNGTANNQEMGALKIQLTDAPFPFDEVAEANVTVFKVDARAKADDEGIDDDAFVVLMEDEIPLNLLDLTNGITETLVDVEVPVGSYDLVRVYVKGVNVVLKDGTTYDLKVPSGEQTGIKVFIEPNIVVNGGLSTDLLLDFDVSKSFVAKGPITNIQGFNFKPVIKASNLSTAGTLMGKVTEIMNETAVGVEGAQVAVYAADTLHTTTFTDVDGSYMILGLLAGDYAVEVAKDGYETSEMVGVSITSANSTTQNFEIMSVPSVEE